MLLKSGKSVQDELSDVLFVPKKRSARKGLVWFLIVVGIILVAFYNFREEFSNMPLLTNFGIGLEVEEDDEPKYMTIVPRTLCNSPGEELYTDWFMIEGDEWSIKLTSDRVETGMLANTRLWYTTSDISMLVEALNPVAGELKSSYIEVGDGRPNGDTENEKIVEQMAQGPGKFRLRTLCWNTRYTVEIKDLYSR